MNAFNANYLLQINIYFYLLYLFLLFFAFARQLEVFCSNVNWVVGLREKKLDILSVIILLRNSTILYDVELSFITIYKNLCSLFQFNRNKKQKPVKGFSTEINFETIHREKKTYKRNATKKNRKQRTNEKKIPFELNVTSSCAHS